MKGRILRIPEGKGFGFIRADGEKGERFFWAGAVDQQFAPFDELEAGDIVEFDPLTADDGRFRAEHVKLLAKDGDFAASSPEFFDPDNLRKGT
jgi:cold shock CspA family protein